MTGYFSIQFRGLEFEVNTYWWAFLIVISISLVFVFLFSLFSGTMEGRIMTRTWSRMVYDISKRWWVHQRNRNRSALE